MSNSPITQRVQAALRMKSALKQTDEEKDKDKKILVDDPRTMTIQEGQFVDQIVPGESTEVNEGLEGSYTGNKLYEGDYYAPDSPLGREMKKLGMTNITPDAIRNYEQSKLIENKQRRLSGNVKDDGAFGDVTASDAEGNKRTLSNEETLALTPEQIGERNQTTTQQGPDQTVSTFEGENKPQDFAVMGQYDAGAAARGNQKAINKAMRTEQKLGAFEGDNPETGKPWTKKEKRLYAAKLTSGQDMGYGTGVGIGGQSYEKNKMVYQKNVGGTENQTFTNIDDPKFRTSAQINPDTGETELKPSMVTTPENNTPREEVSSVGELQQQELQELETKPIEADLSALKPRAQAETTDDKDNTGKNTFLAMKQGSAVKMSPLKSKSKAMKIFKESVQTGMTKKKKPNFNKLDAEDIDFVEVPNTKSSTDLVPSGPGKGGGNINFKSGGTENFAKTAGESTSFKAGKYIGKNILGPGGKIIKPIVKYGTAAAVGAGVYSMFSGSDGDKTEQNTTTGGGGTGGGGTTTPTTTTTPSTTPVTKPKPVTKIGGIRRDLPTGADYSPGSGNRNNVTVGRSLSNTLASQNEADKMTRAEGRQARKNMRLANRQKRRAMRRANPTAIGGTLRSFAGGKTYDSNINNFKQNNKGQFSKTKRPGYNA